MNFKRQLLQILLGAAGSALTVLASYLAGVGADAVLGAAAAAGPATTLTAAKIAPATFGLRA